MKRDFAKQHRYGNEEAYAEGYFGNLSPTADEERAFCNKLGMEYIESESGLGIEPWIKP